MCRRDDFMKVYFKEISKNNLLAKEKEIELAKKIKAGDNEAKNKLVEANLRLVIKIVKDVIKTERCSHLTLFDLIQEGNIGLFKAAEKFDIKKDCRFSTYAIWWIRQSIVRAILEKEQTIYVAVHMSEKVRAYNRVKTDLIKKFRRDPAIDEIAIEMELTQKEVRKINNAFKEVVSFDDPIGGNDFTEEYFIADKEHPTAYQLLLRRELREKLNDFLIGLSAQERKILVLRFGLNDGIPRTLEYIGEKFELTRERIRQIEAKAIKKLRNRIRRRNPKLREMMNISGESSY